MNLRMLVTALALVSASPTVLAQEKTLTLGATRVQISGYQKGVSIKSAGVSISNASSMVVTTPPWTPHYYLGPAPEAIEAGVVERSDEHVSISINHRGQHGAFTAEETITLRQGGIFEQELIGKFNKPEGEALIQWRMAALDPAILIGRPYRAILNDGSEITGVVPVLPKRGNPRQTAIASDFKTLEFNTRIGTLRITSESDRPLICYDFRGSKWADASRPLIWLGDLDSRITMDKPLRYKLRMELPRNTPKADGLPPMLQGRSGPIKLNLAQHYDLAKPPVILPTPKEASFTPELFKLSDSVSIQSLPGKIDDRAVQELERALKSDWKLQLKSPAQQANITFEIGATKPEGYALTIDSNGVTISAADTAGFLHAVQTLKQLYALDDQNQAALRACKINDWPTLGYRGVHLFTGGRGPDLHLKLVRDLLAPLKFNQLLFQCEYTEWESAPEIHHPQYGMPKSEVATIIAAARSLGLEVSPLVMSLGHCQWIFETGHHLDLAEDPEAKWAYCVTNPRTYEFIYKIYQEAVDLFQPKYFHIGHDEYTERGRVPYRESSKPYTPEQLFMMDTLKHHAWFKERNIRVMMWGDMLLARGEGPDACHADTPEIARSMRNDLPKDIVITDWHYVDTAPENFNNLEVFHKDGFETIASTWYRPGNIINFARAAHDQGSLGLLQTTWAGYSLDPESFAREERQYATYVLAAEAAWNADRDIDPDSFPHGEYFMRLMGNSTLKPANKKGWLAPLSRVYNDSTKARDANGWFGLGVEHDLSAFPRGRADLHGIEFQLGSEEHLDTPNASVLAGLLTGDRDLPGRVELILTETADQLVFLHTLSAACRKDTKVGWFEVLYEDGARAKIDLVYGKNTLAYNDLAAAAEAPILWSGHTPSGTKVAVRGLIWDNPKPHVKIRAVYARSSYATGSIVWLGLTGLQTSEPKEPADSSSIRARGR